jgi:hypothetical protein
MFFLKYSVLWAPGTVVFRDEQESKLSHAISQRYFSHRWKYVGKDLYLNGLLELGES